MPNHQIERDASPAALRLLARAPHLERSASEQQFVRCVRATIHKVGKQIN